MARKLMVNGVLVLLRKVPGLSKPEWVVVVGGRDVGAVVKNGDGDWVGASYRGEARGYENSWMSMKAAAAMVVRDAARA
jgi:hypothetical protein